jgi:hypothetical protein
MTTTDLRSVIIERLASAESALATLDARGPAAVQALGSGNPSAALLSSHLAEATSYSRRVVSLQRGMAEKLGNGEVLSSAAVTIARDVSAASRTVAAEATPQALQATDPAKWSSEARDAYAAGVERWTAEPRIPQLADDIEQGLRALIAAEKAHGASLARSADTTLVAILQLVAALASWESLLLGVTSVVAEMSAIATSLSALQQQTGAATSAIEHSLRAATARARG